MRKLSKFWGTVISVVSVAFVIFHFWTAGFGLYSDLIQRSIHIAVSFFILFILIPVNKKSEKAREKVPFYDVILALLSLATGAFILLNYNQILAKPYQWLNALDLIFAVIFVALVLEASRRSVGSTFLIMGALLLGYSAFGRQMPGIWAHGGFSFNMIFQTLYHTTSGVYGSMVGTSATMLAMFGIFGAVLSATGGAQTFITIGEKLCGRSTGGPGKVTLIASGLFGMVSGSAMANVLATGTFTIPLMKKVGYDKEWSAAITAVGATGGQIMPPVMGAGAFLMAQFLGVSYLSIAKAALVPAILYYLGAFAAVHFLSVMKGIRGEKVDIKIKVDEYIIIFVPLLVFLYYLYLRYSVMSAAFYATVGGVVISFLCSIPGRKPDAIVQKNGKMLYATSKSAAYVIMDSAALLAGAQVTIALIAMSGLGIKLSDLIVSVGRSDLFLCLALSMIICIILGMGLPTTAAYVLAAAVMVPALVTLKMNILMAHMFVFFFSALATITPPVCSAVYMSAKVADAKWFKTGVLSVWIALPAFIVPFTFAYNRSLLLIGSPLEVAVSVFTALIGVVSMGIAVAGYFAAKLPAYTRILLIIGGILMIVPHILSSLIGFAVIFLCLYIARPGKAAA